GALDQPLLEPRGFVRLLQEPLRALELQLERRERRLELVRRHQQELIARADRLLRLGVELRVGERDAGAVREILHQPQIAVVEAAAAGVGVERKDAERAIER